MTEEHMTTTNHVEKLAVIERMERALRELERWVTEDSDCRTQAQRMAGRKALIQALTALPQPTEGGAGR